MGRKRRASLPHQAQAFAPTIGLKSRARPRATRAARAKAKRSATGSATSMVPSWTHATPTTQTTARLHHHGATARVKAKAPPPTHNSWLSYRLLARPQHHPTWAQSPYAHEQPQHRKGTAPQSTK